jgi:hypothetical protein
MYRSLGFSVLLIGSLASPSAAPGQDKQPEVLLGAGPVITAVDLWEELRQVDPAFKALPAEVARIAKGLEAEEIATRGKAAAELRALGLSTYGAIKEAREKAASAALKLEFDSVLTGMAGETAKSLKSVPGARRMSSKVGEALRARLKEKGLAAAEPRMGLFDGQPAQIFMGEEAPLGYRRRRIQIEGDGTSVRFEQEGPLVRRGFQVKLIPKVLDLEKGKLSLDITALAQGLVGMETMEVSLSFKPELTSGDCLLLGPFPAAEEKGTPWWIFVDCKVIKP